MKSPLRYWTALLLAAAPSAVARAAALRLGRRGGIHIPRGVSRAAMLDAAFALASPTRSLFGAGRRERALYRLLFPTAAARVRARAEEILAHRIELFGVIAPRGARLDWHRDPSSGHRFDPTATATEIRLQADGLDPRGPWELGRAAHLVELGVAARLHPDLAGVSRAEVAATIDSFLDDNPLGVGIHWTAPLEVAMRAIHWLAALDLTGGLRPAGVAFRRRLGGALIEHGRFLAENLEDRGVAVGNHLLGELTGLLAIGVFLDGTPEGDRWRAAAARRLPIEAARQVCGDGADFEGSTSYHRFALEILLAAELFARVAGLDLGLGAVLRRMFAFVRGYLGPDGAEPAFGDGDDGRVLPTTPRHPRDHGYLLSVGAARFGEAAWKPPGARFCEEAVWLVGAAGYRRWRALPHTLAPRIASFPDGGVYVLRGREGDQVALRCGGHGQRGVGGHSHNDQLSLAVWLGGAPLIIDSGTFCYTADPLWRDRFRGAAAHSTVVVDGREQSPVHDGRPFALPDRARARLLWIEDRDDVARIGGEHSAWMRLRFGVRHHREVLLDRPRRAVAVTDRLLGQGDLSVEARFQLGSIEVAPLDDERLREALRRLAEERPWAMGLAIDGALLLSQGGRPCAMLAAIAPTPRPELVAGWWSPRWGERRPATVARFGGRLTLPAILRTALVLVPDG